MPSNRVSIATTGCSQKLTDCTTFLQPVWVYPGGCIQEDTDTEAEAGDAGSFTPHAVSQGDSGKWGSGQAVKILESDPAPALTQ